MIGLFRFFQRDDEFSTLTQSSTTDHKFTELQNINGGEIGSTSKFEMTYKDDVIHRGSITNIDNDKVTICIKNTIVKYEKYGLRLIKITKDDVLEFKIKKHDALFRMFNINNSTCDFMSFETLYRNNSDKIKTKYQVEFRYKPHIFFTGKIVSDYTHIEDCNPEFLKTITLVPCDASIEDSNKAMDCLSSDILVRIIEFREPYQGLSHLYGG
jgi:hypothetical protein